MADSAYKQTARILNQTLRRLNRLYTNADRQIRQDVDFEVLYLADDEATERERLRYAKENGLDDAIAVIVALILSSNEQAIGIINGSLDGVYTLNFEAAAQQIRVDIASHRFNLQDTLGKYTKRAYQRQTSFRHVTEEVEKAIRKTFGEGKGIRDIARSVQRVTGKSKTSALTTARTETFRVANESRFELGKQAQAAGLTVTKTWVHMHAAQKTYRDGHVAMSGETVPLDEPFSNGLMEPLDVNAPPEETINCRCRIELQVAD